MGRPIINVKELTKIYKMKDGSIIKALDNVSFIVNKQMIFGLLGPNGAGKTTLINILSTLVPPTSGTALIDGMDVIKDKNKIRGRIGFVFDYGMVYPRLTGRNNLRFFAKLYGISDFETRLKPIITQLHLERWMNEYVQKYSLGMKMKLSLARVLLQDPDILILDEPTRGMDVNTVFQITDVIRQKGREKTIIVTSHDMSVMEKICDRIAFINNGNIIASGAPVELMQLVQGKIEMDVLLRDDPNPLIKELRLCNYINQVNENGVDGMIIEISGRQHVQDLLKLLANYRVEKVSERTINLETLFKRIIDF